MPDPAQQLQAFYLAGFEMKTFARFPNAVGLIKGNCIALVQTTETGLQLIGQPGWHMGEVRCTRRAGWPTALPSQKRAD